MSKDQESLKFNLELQYLPVEVGGEQYKIYELTGTQRDAYLTSSAARLKVVGKGEEAVQKITNFNGLEGSLVAMALRKVMPGGEEQEVPLTEIQGWPAKVVSALNAKARELSGLGEEEEEGEGND